MVKGFPEVTQQQGQSWFTEVTEAHMWPQEVAP